MAVGSTVTERLTRQLDELLFTTLPNKWQVVRKGVAVPQITLLQEQLQAIRALRAGSPAGRALLGPVQNHFRRALDDVAFFVFGQVPRNLMMIAMTGDLVTLGDDRGHLVRIALGNAATGKKSSLHFVGRKNAKNSPNTSFGAVLCLGIFFMIHLAVFVRLNVFAALKIEAEQDGDAGIARPVNFAIGMKFFERHHEPPKLPTLGILTHPQHANRSSRILINHQLITCKLIHKNTL